MDNRAGAWAVVLAGGEGLRLRSVTRAIVGDDRPKQYVPLISGDSLLRQTLTRAAELSRRERTVAVSQQDHAGWLAAELSAHRGVTRLLQPENRDTAAGVLLPVYWIAARDPEATVVVYPSDHFVREGAAFLAHVAEVVTFVDRQRDGIILPRRARYGARHRVRLDRARGRRRGHGIRPGSSRTSPARSIRTRNGDPGVR